MHAVYQSFISYVERSTGRFNNHSGALSRGCIGCLGAARGRLRHEFSMSC